MTILRPGTHRLYGEVLSRSWAQELWSEWKRARVLGSQNPLIWDCARITTVQVVRILSDGLRGCFLLFFGLEGDQDSLLWQFGSREKLLWSFQAGSVIETNNYWNCTYYMYCNNSNVPDFGSTFTVVAWITGFLNTGFSSSDSDFSSAGILPLTTAVRKPSWLRQNSEETNTDYEVYINKMLNKIDMLF